MTQDFKKLLETPIGATEGDDVIGRPNGASKIDTAKLRESLSTKTRASSSTDAKSRSRKFLICEQCHDPRCPWGRWTE